MCISSTMPVSQTPFLARHLGPSPGEQQAMLERIGVDSLDRLIDETIPAAIRRHRPLDLPAGKSEDAYLEHVRELAAANRVCRSYIGLGYADTITPPVILRNVMENPGWYTPYTPYQAEIAQGRLEALLNFQTMITDLTGMEVANASLLDEGTAAAEAMGWMHRLQNRKSRGEGRHTLLVSAGCFPQTVAVLRNRAEPLGITLVIGEPENLPVDHPDAFGIILQTPDHLGRVVGLDSLVERAHARDLLVAVATDLLCLTLFKPAGESGADVVFGSAQRFGVPLGYGGPHAAFFATAESGVREMPGRIIGVTPTAEGRPGYRMALQTREQHIRREKAKSNICTAQALLANMAGFYAVYHGPEGLTAIARRVHGLAAALAELAAASGWRQRNQHFFDTVQFEPGEGNGHAIQRLRERAVARGFNFRYLDDAVTVSVGESATLGEIHLIGELFAEAVGKQPGGELTPPAAEVDASLRRTTRFLQHEVFHRYRTETEMMRYLARLQRRDIGLDASMIPLGSCTMKLNAAAEMMPVTWPEFSAIHPFAPADQAAGYHAVHSALESDLAAITGLHAVSLQPNSGAQGEYAGLTVIRAYHHDRGEDRRRVVLIPSSAHGTNPASAVMAGFEVVVVACDDNGNIDLDDLHAKVAAHVEDLAGLMVTYPSTHGVFEPAIRDICALVHEHGGQVYMDGANLNAQVGLTSPAAVGADVCHINLHKTFSIPHGGGGPGMGPIAVAEHLAPYLPGHPLVETGGSRALPPVSSAPWGSASILLISYGYLRLLGAEGATEATRVAILNANYVKDRLAPHYPVLFVGENGRVAHEVIFDMRAFKPAGVTETDVAKRLMDYGFHAPTVSWPVPGTIMIEPTESECQAELDRFCDAMIGIRAEIEDVVTGKTDATDNVLVNAPHTIDHVAANHWTHPYSREQAAFPLPWLREGKVWPTVSRIDNTAGDRNLQCTCPPLDAYE